MEDLGCAVVCRKELWLCASGRFKMRSGMPQGIVFIREWEDLGCVAYLSHVQQKVMKLDFHMAFSLLYMLNYSSSFGDVVQQRR